MSKWTEIRDTAVEALNAEGVGKDIKDKFIDWLVREGMAFLQAVADKVVAQCKADAGSESGWCKIRDAFVIPAAISIGMYVLEMVIEKAGKA
jgi:hypothetical protein